MEGCYNTFIGSENSQVYSVFERDLCGYMYLFNNNQTLLAQYANLSTYRGVADAAFEGVGYYQAPGTLFSHIGPVLFKDLGLNSAYPGLDSSPNFYPSYLGTTLYANMACAYEHWAVSAPLLKLLAPLSAHEALWSGVSNAAGVRGTLRWRGRVH